MYGYIVVNKPEMKFKDFDVYRSYYCGLCTVLKRKYGFAGQLSLSYDMTFLIMLLNGLYEPEIFESDKKCIVHPFEKQHHCISEITDYVADMNIYLTYNKCMDDWEDEKKVSRRIYAAGLDKRVKEINANYQAKCLEIENQLKNISEAEKRKEENIDVMSAYFGNIMSEIFCIYEDQWNKNLRNMGFFLGKFIYIIDAYEDIENDIKKGNYNPLIKYKDQEDFDEWCKQILIMIIEKCAMEFERLPILKDVDILRNILYSGVWTRFEMVRNRRKKN